MALRIFTDSAGHEWQAYDVVPRRDERRQYDRRASAKLVSGDRRSDDRRITVGRFPALTPTLVDGWLCFEHGSECRRLSPIPADWRRCSEGTLERYCQTARPARDGHLVDRKRATEL